MSRQGVPFPLQLTPGQPQHTRLLSAQSTRLLPCWKNMSAPRAQAGSTRTSPVPQGNTTFISVQLMLEPTPVCMLILQKTPTGVQDTSQRNQGSVTKWSAQLLPILNLLAAGEHLGHISCLHWGEGNSRHKVLPVLLRPSSWYLQKSSPGLREVCTLFQCHWNAAGAISEEEDGVVASWPAAKIDRVFHRGVSSQQAEGDESFSWGLTQNVVLSSFMIPHL